MVDHSADHPRRHPADLPHHCPYHHPLVSHSRRMLYIGLISVDLINFWLIESQRRDDKELLTKW